jgi:hypothetical protein
MVEGLQRSLVKAAVQAVWSSVGLLKSGPGEPGVSDQNQGPVFKPLIRWAK